MPSTARPPASADAGPYRDAPPVLETVPLDDEARARVEKEISSATAPLIICGMLLTGFFVGLYASHGWLLVAFPLDFVALGLAIAIRVELREILRARADRRHGMVRGEAEVRWRKGDYQWVLEDGRSFRIEGDPARFGRHRVVVLPRLGAVLRHELIDEAVASEARALEDEAMDAVLRVTPSSLEANVAGRITPWQRQKMARDLIGFALVMLLFGSFAMAKPWFSLVSVPVVLLLGWACLDNVRAMLTGRVRIVEGEVTCHRKGGKYPSYYLIVQDIRYSVSETAFRAFRLVGERHRFYVTDDNRVLAVRALA